MEQPTMQKSLTTINNVALLVLAFGLPFALLPLRPPYGFERNILLIVIFLALLALRATTNFTSGNKSYNTYRTYLLVAAAALVAAAFLAAQGEARWANLTNLTLWASIAGILVAVVLPRRISERGSDDKRASLLFLVGAAVAAVALIGQISPVGPINQGLDYRTSLSITSKTLSRSPIWGAGPGRFSEAFMQYKGADFNRRPDWGLKYGLSHSGFLQFVTEYGFIGLIGVISLIMGLIRPIEPISRRELALTALPFGVLLAAFLLLPYSPGIWWAGAFLGATHKTYKTNKNDD